MSKNDVEIFKDVIDMFDECESVTFDYTNSDKISHIKIVIVGSMGIKVEYAISGVSRDTVNYLFKKIIKLKTAGLPF